MAQPLSRFLAGDDSRTSVDQPVKVAAVAGHLTLGERLADRVAAFGGSWTFILCFAAILVSWVLLNSEILPPWHRQFDPYPYILLNLFLSALAALQAPVIMMSQNRQAAKDRVQAAHDYEINLRAELKITALHEKLDTLRDVDLAEALRRVERKLDKAEFAAVASRTQAQRSPRQVSLRCD